MKNIIIGLISIILMSCQTKSFENAEEHADSPLESMVSWEDEEKLLQEEKIKQRHEFNALMKLKDFYFFPNDTCDIGVGLEKLQKHGTNKPRWREHPPLAQASRSGLFEWREEVIKGVRKKWHHLELATG